MTEGERIEAEWLEDRDIPISQRIDAALAEAHNKALPMPPPEVEDAVDAWWAVNAADAYLDGQRIILEGDLADLKARLSTYVCGGCANREARLVEYMKALAEHEAQITEMREAALALLAVCDCVGDDEDPKYGVPKKALRAAIRSLGPKKVSI